MNHKYISLSLLSISITIIYIYYYNARVSDRILHGTVSTVVYIPACSTLPCGPSTPTSTPAARRVADRTTAYVYSMPLNSATTTRSPCSARYKLLGGRPARPRRHPHAATRSRPHRLRHGRTVHLFASTSSTKASHEPHSVRALLQRLCEAKCKKKTSSRSWVTQVRLPSPVHLYDSGFVAELCSSCLVITSR